MRLIEGLRIRVKDVEFSRREILVRNGKGGRDRVTVLPENLIAPLQEQIAKARALHQRDLSDGHGAVWLPGALDAKYPGAPRQWGCSRSRSDKALSATFSASRRNAAHGRQLSRAAVARRPG
jgi:integrase